ncbi:MAG: PfkB family carbohydrate kinase [Pseudomonadota bacterium]
MTRILVVGSSVVDLVFQVSAFPARPEKHKAQDARIVGGGCAGNAAVAIARLGGQARLATRVGDDLIGQMILDDLTREGVDTGPSQVTQGGRSAFSSVYVTPDGERQIMAFRGAGLAPDLDRADLGSPAAVLADTRWDAAARTALAHARARGVPGVLDGEAPVAPALMGLASHVAFSAQGLRDLTGAQDLDTGLRRVAKQTGAWVCVTDGAAGTYVWAGGRVEHFAAQPVDTIDTLGAGDIWHGAFALALGEGRGETDAVRFANAAASLKCSRPGGRAGAPGRAETDAFMQGAAQ